VKERTRSIVVDRGEDEEEDLSQSKIERDEGAK